MLAIIRKGNWAWAAACGALVLLAMGVSSCATKEPASLINDPNAKKETALPWNEQTKWEREGQGAELNQQRR